MINLQTIALFIVLIMLASCKTNQMNHTSVPEAGMFKVAILYPGGEDKSFDMDYYEKNHMPMMAGFLGKNLRFYEIDKGIGGRTPTDKAPFVAVGYFFIADVAEYNKAIVQHIDTIRKDILKYTNIQPTIQISEVRHIGHNDRK